MLAEIKAIGQLIQTHEELIMSTALILIGLALIWVAVMLSNQDN